MKSLINKTTNVLSGIALFAVGCVMTGLGLATVTLLALFAMASIGVALLVAPLLAMTQPAPEDVEEADEATAAA